MIDTRVFMLGVGAQKAGTTWLHRYLDAHPQCWMSPIKEMHFFDELFLPEAGAGLAGKHYERLESIVGRLIRGDRPPLQRLEIAHDLLDRAAMKGSIPRYLDFFAARIGGARVFGEISPSYSLLGQAHFAEIARHHPDIRPVFLMRDPVDRFWSALRMRERESEGFSALDAIGAQLRSDQVVLRGRYDLTLKALRPVFGDRLLVLFYEDLFREESIARLCAHLGLDPHPADFEKRENVSPEIAGLGAEHQARIFETFRPVYEHVAATGTALPEAWARRLADFG